MEKSFTSLVPHYATTARVVNVVKNTCKWIEFCMALLTKKNSTFQKVRWRSAKKTARVLTYRTWRRKCFNSSERYSFRKIYYKLF